MAIAFDYNRPEPCVIRETARWAVVYKPPHLPTAPLRADERQTLVYWFLHRAEAGATGYADDTQDPFAEYGQCIQEAPSGNKPKMPAAGQRIRGAQVRGKKAIEAGLLHRLDTDTRGLVLFAKDQRTYDFFSAQQDTGGIVKTYYAFIESGAAAAAERITQQLPYTLQSQFRNFGPGAKKAAPVFPHSRHFTKDGRIYTTVIEAVTVTAGAIGVRCHLQRGYRHQVRTHLAALGLPIAGDPLYGSGKECESDTAAHAEHGLQLYATALSLPNPQNRFQRISAALPPPDRMTL